jgi:hypothetical protein
MLNYGPLRDILIKYFKNPIITPRLITNQLCTAGDRWTKDNGLVGASMAEWLRSLTSNHLSLTAMGSNPDREFGLFHVRKLYS